MSNGSRHDSPRPAPPGLRASSTASLATLALALLASGSAAVAAATDPATDAARTSGEAHVAARATPSAAPASGRWTTIREQLLGDRAVSSEERVVRLEVAPRALDGARVPVTVHAARDAGAEGFVERLHLIVDNNPVPVAATFDFEPGVGWNSIDTELRIDEYSNVRVVAELAGGGIDMSTRFVKAVGGCSAPPSSYERSDATQLGSFRGGLDEILNPQRPVTARIRLVHPNASGMQFDQFTRTYIPPHYVHTMGAAFDGEPLFTLATNFSLSQDPVLGFDFRAPRSGTLSLYALDSKARRFEKSWPVRVAAAAE